MLLAGDIGGTKSLLGLFTSDETGRPVPHVTRSYPTKGFSGLLAMLDAFEIDLGEPLKTEAAVFGLAGPVRGGSRAHLTNVGWEVVLEEVVSRLGGTPALLMNDLEATGHALTTLADDELAVLQQGVPDDSSHVAVIAAGTGLGEAYVRRIGTVLTPFASESGHADFAPRTAREMELARELQAGRGRVSVEDVVSGPGLRHLHRFTHRGGECELVQDVEAADAPAAISRAGLGGRCQACAEALRMFVAAYGAEAGNLALRSLALAGLYVGGGIAPKILPALRNGTFMEAFLTKAPMTDLLSRIPVRVILNSQAALLGAAVRAQALARSGGP